MTTCYVENVARLKNDDDDADKDVERKVDPWQALRNES